MLYDALAACIKDKPVGDISITELVQRAMVGRGTFYRNFDELVDVLYWKCDRQFAEVLQGYMQYGGREKLGLLEYVFGYWQENVEILEILLSIGRIDIIYKCFAKLLLFGRQILLRIFRWRSISHNVYCRHAAGQYTAKVSVPVWNSASIPPPICCINS